MKAIPKQKNKMIGMKSKSLARTFNNLIVFYN